MPLNTIPLEYSVLTIDGVEDAEHLSINLATVYKKIEDSLLQDEIEEYFKKLIFTQNLEVKNWLLIFFLICQQISLPYFLKEVTALESA